MPAASAWGLVSCLTCIVQTIWNSFWEQLLKAKVIPAWHETSSGLGERLQDYLLLKYPLADRTDSEHNWDATSANSCLQKPPIAS